MSDIAALIPAPVLYRIGGEELRQSALPVRKLLAVVQFVEKNADLLEKFQVIGLPADKGGKTFSTMLGEDVYVRVYALLRMLIPSSAEKMTDEWCMDFLSNAHIAAIVKTAITQNELDGLFKLAKDLVGPKMLEVFRQKMKEQAPAAEATQG